MVVKRNRECDALRVGGSEGANSTAFCSDKTAWNNGWSSFVDTFEPSFLTTCPAVYLHHSLCCKHKPHETFVAQKSKWLTLVQNSSTRAQLDPLHLTWFARSHLQNNDHMFSRLPKSTAVIDFQLVAWTEYKLQPFVSVDDTFQIKKKKSLTHQITFHPYCY